MPLVKLLNGDLLQIDQVDLCIDLKYKIADILKVGRNSVIRVYETHENHQEDVESPVLLKELPDHSKISEQQVYTIFIDIYFPYWVQQSLLDIDELLDNPNAKRYLTTHPDGQRRVKDRQVDTRTHKLIDQKLRTWPNYSSEQIDELDRRLKSSSESDRAQYRKFFPEMSADPTAVHLLEKYPDLIHTEHLMMNSGAIHLIEQYDLSKLRVEEKRALSINKNALPFLFTNPSLIDWSFLVSNPHPYVYGMIENYIETRQPTEYYFWLRLARQPLLLPFLKKYIDSHQESKENVHIETWIELAKQPCIEAIALLEKYLFELPIGLIRVIWGHMSSNPCAVSLLGTRPELINYKGLSRNRGLFY